MNLYKYILSILFPVVLSVLTFSCKEEAGIELFQNLDIVGEVPVQGGSLRCTCSSRRHHQCIRRSGKVRRFLQR